VDFVRDSPETGRLKCLAVVEDFTKEVVADHGISGRWISAWQIDSKTLG